MRYKERGGRVLSGTPVHAAGRGRQGQVALVSSRQAEQVKGDCRQQQGRCLWVWEGNKGQDICMGKH